MTLESFKKSATNKVETMKEQRIDMEKFLISIVNK